MSHLRRSLPTLFLALLPGLCLTLIALVHYPDGPPSDGLWQAAPLLVAAGLVTGSWARFRELRAWSLPASGYLIAVGLPSLIDVLPAGPSSYERAISSFLWMFGTAVVAILLLWHLHRVRPLPARLWLLLGLALLAQPLVVVIGGILLLPAALALLLARRHGGQSTLLALAALYWPVAGIFDPGYGILIWRPQQMETQFILTLLPALIFLLMAPAGLLLARSRFQTAVAVLAPVALGLLAGELWRSALFAGTTRGSYDLSMWLTRGGAILQHTLLLAWILAGCWWYQEERSPATEAVEMAPARR